MQLFARGLLPLKDPGPSEKKEEEEDGLVEVFINSASDTFESPLDALKLVSHEDEEVTFTKDEEFFLTDTIDSELGFKLACGKPKLKSTSWSSLS